MELSFAQQSVAFGWSFALGAGLGVLYGLLRFLRFSFSLGKTAVFALDLLFMLTWATAAFFFSLAFLRGFVRFYVFIGSLGGFLLYRLTIGRFLCRLYQPVVRFIGKVSQKISEKITKENQTPEKRRLPPRKRSRPKAVRGWLSDRKRRVSCAMFCFTSRRSVLYSTP